MIGIDVAKATLAVCEWDPRQEEPSWERSYPNSEQGVERLLTDTPAEMAWVLEPTGSYSELAVRRGQAGGRRVLMAHTFAAKHFLKSVNPRAKTDKVDARGLAQYGNAVRLREYSLKEAPLQLLWELLQVRCALARARAALCQQIAAFPQVAPYARAIVRDLQAHMERLEEEIEKAGGELDLFVRLLKIPGVGLLTAASLTIRLLSKEFATDDAFVAYMGLDLRVHDSGKRKGKRGLTKRGDAQLRWLLYLAARATLRAKRGQAFQEYYARKLGEGWTKTGTICMLARKLAKVAWSMARSGQKYDPTRVFRREAVAA